MARLFPGVDPFLESQDRWQGFHTRFITYWQEAIGDKLPDHYEVNIEERIELYEDPERKRTNRRPDVSIHRVKSPRSYSNGGRIAIATVEPVVLPLPEPEPVPKRFLHIYHLPDRKLVTALEFLSPTHKEGGRSEYLVKRQNLLKKKVHLFELDLLLKGRRLPVDGALPEGDYFAFLSRGDHRPDCEVYSWHLGQPLPTLPVPLLAPDPDLLIDLDAVFDLAFERARYGRSLNYDKMPPRLNERQRATVRGCLRQRRTSSSG